MYERIKAFLSDDTIFFALLIILVGVVSFGLGRASVVPSVSSQPAGIIFSDKSADSSIKTESAVDPEVDDGAPAVAAEAQYVASKNGSKYHFPWCSGAKQMKEENKVWFDSVEAAKAAGYTPAANCPGL